jgi:hypothetical protein
LVAWWPGDGNANDVGSTNNGTLQGGATFTTGMVGQAFNFDGVNGYVEVANSSNLNPAASFSIEGWIFPRKDQTEAIMSKWADTPDQLNQRSYGFNVCPNEVLQFAISDWAHQWDASFQVFNTTNNAFVLNTWSHVAAVYDQPAGARRIYVNGVKVAERIDPPITVTNSTARVGIGANLFSATGSRGYFDGLIDELSFYSTALSTAEIQAIYNAGSAGKCVPQPPNCIPPPSGLVGWWPGEGNAVDIAGTNNGALYHGVGFVPGMVGQAISFNGTNSYVEVPDSPSLRLTNVLSIEFWVKRQDLQGEDYILNKGGDYTRGALNYGVTLNRAAYNDTLAFTFAGGFRRSASIADTNWHHVAVVAHNGDADPTFYLDGVQKPVTARGGPSTIALYPSTEALHIGAQVDPLSGWSIYSKAIVDELSIYNRALSAAEIQTIYTAGSAGKCVSPPSNCIPPSSGLVGWWPGEGNANDIAGTNNGTLQGAGTFTTGMVGQAINLNGSSQYVDVPSSASLNPSSSVSLEAWIYPRLPLNSVGSPIIKKAGEGLGQQDGYSLEFSGTDGVVFAVNVDGTVWWLATDPAPVPFSQWSHVAGVYDGTNVSIYVNGLLASRRLGAHPAPIVPSANHLQLGHDPSNPSRYFNGLIDEASIYRTALSSAQIQAIYTAGSAGKCVQQPANCVPPPSGLVGWWPGDGNANDTGGTNNGTLQGGATFTTGMVGQAINLNGSSQYVDVPNSASLNPTASISLEAWIYPRLPLNSIGSPIIKKAGEGLAQQDGYTLEFSGTNGVVFGVNVNGSVWWLATPPAPVPLSRWSHVVGVYDGTNASIYVNGMLVTRALGVSPAPIVPSGNDLQLGHDPSNPSRYFNGLIDEASIYRTALSSAQIQAIYTAGSVGKCVQQPANCVPPPSGLVGWWPGDGNANDIGGANNGTLQGGAAFTTGIVGQAINLNGSSQYVDVPNSASLNPTASISLEAWIYPRLPLNSIGSPIIKKAGEGLAQQDGYSLEFMGTNGVIFSVNVNGTVWGFATDPAPVPFSQWSHVAGVYDGTNVSIYVNGLLVSRKPGAHPAPIVPSANHLQLGHDPSNPSRYFNGLIDEASIYSTALSSAQIQAIYTAGSAGKCGSAITPLPRAATATATMVNDFVVGVTITDGGWGYTNTPIVRISGGGGSGARAVAVVSNGVVIAINILDAGYGYTSTPSVVIDPPFMANPVLDLAPMSFLVFSNLTLGGVYQMQQWVGWYWLNQPVSFTAANTLYTQMVAGVAGSGDYRLAINPVPTQAFATAQVVNGFVVGATVTSRGSGYVTSPAVTIFGGGGINATAVSHISGGVVTSISITDAGIGFTAAPTVRIAPPPAAAVSPMVLPVMRLDSSNLVPYDNYQIQFKPDLGEAWGNWSGGLFIPTDVTSSQYLFITNGVGFFRLQNVP